MEAFPLMNVSILPVGHCSYEPAKSKNLNSAMTMRNFVQVIVADSSQNQKKQTLDVLPGGKHWIVTDFAAKKDIIMAGMGWGGLPEYLIHKELKRGVLVQLNVEGFEVRHAQLYAIRRTDKPVGVIGDALWMALKKLTFKLRKSGNK